MCLLVTKKTELSSLHCELCWWPENVNSLCDWNIRSAIIVAYSSGKEELLAFQVQFKSCS